MILNPRPREYRGFVVIRDGGHDLPWRGWHPAGIKVRSDTLEGLKAAIRDNLPR